MLGWFSPQCPLSGREKAWLEVRTNQLAEQLGLARMRQVEVVLPNEEFFPEDYWCSPHDAEHIMRRLCDHLKLNSERLRLHVLPDESLHDAFSASLSGRAHINNTVEIRIAESQLLQPDLLVAAFAHELAREVGVSSGWLDVHQPDHEWMVELLAVYLGFGVFLANGVLRESYVETGTLSWWAFHRRGQMPARMIGYALALFAWTRNDAAPSWASYLRRDASTALKQGLRFLAKGGDCLFQPHLQNRRNGGSVADLLIDLRSGSPTAKFAALWRVEEMKGPPRELFDAVFPLTQSRDRELRADAVRAVAAFPEMSNVAAPHLLDRLQDECPGVRSAAALAIGLLRLENPTAVVEIAALLSDESAEVVSQAAFALSVLGRRDDTAARRLFRALKNAIAECDFQRVEALARAIGVVAEDPELLLDDVFADYDEELIEHARTALKEYC